MKLVKKLLDIFKGSNEGVGLISDQLTNKRLLEELTSHFKTMLNAESVGQRMLYPMSFNILMDPADYNDRRQSLPFVLPQVVSAFYGIIDDMRQEYPDYTPPAKYWYFQFSACQLGTIQTGDSTPLIVRKGHITTVATLLTFDIKEANMDLVRAGIILYGLWPSDEVNKESYLSLTKLVYDTNRYLLDIS